MEPRQILILRSCWVAVLVIVFQAVIDSCLFAPPLVIGLECGLALAFALITRVARRGYSRLGMHLFLATAHLGVLIFDDGFRGSIATWALYLPLLLAAPVLFDRPEEPSSWIWGTITFVCMALVNFTDLTPHLSMLSENGNVALIRTANILSAFGSSYFLLRFLQDGNRQALQASRALTEALRSERDRAESAARVKSDFLSHMSHELRTPLNAVIGFSDLLAQSTRLDPEPAEYAMSIRTAAHHLLHLVSDVLDLSRLESGNLALARTDFSPGRGLEEIQLMLAPAALDKGLHLRLQVEEGVPRVWGDPVRWRQILLNLAGNAVRYTRRGGVDIRLRWEGEKAEHGRLIAEVADTGPGIPPLMQDAIFERFRRLESPQGANPDGAGLGLAIARQLTQAMGGEVSLESEVGKGSTFRIVIPLEICSADSATSEDQPTSTDPLSGIKVLLCEDNRLNARLAAQTLRKLGLDFDHAADGGQAIERLSSKSYDAILLDLHMPILDGWQVADAIRNGVDLATPRNVPILALTADAFEETRRRTREAGMNEFLAKPFRLAELESRLRHVLAPAIGLKSAERC